jgi:hypothetical protein
MAAPGFVIVYPHPVPGADAYDAALPALQHAASILRRSGMPVAVTGQYALQNGGGGGGSASCCSLTGSVTHITNSGSPPRAATTHAPARRAELTVTSQTSATDTRRPCVATCSHMATARLSVIRAPGRARNPPGPPLPRPRSPGVGTRWRCPPRACRAHRKPPISALRSASAALGNPANRHRAVPLTFEQFRYSFANAVDEDQARRLYETFAVPAPGAPLWQAAAANFNPRTEDKVDTKNPERGPLLVISGENDHTVPHVLANAAYQHQLKNPGVTEFAEIPGRGHSLTIDDGWQEVADTALTFIRRFA